MTVPLRTLPTHFAKIQTGSKTSNMVWGAIMFDHWIPLVHTSSHLTADHYATQVVEPVVLPALVTRSEYHRTPVGCHWTWHEPRTTSVNYGPLRTAVDVAWQRLTQATINTLIDSIPCRFETCIAAGGGCIRY
ncbi:hypothetical protein TNCV_708631 [Trichonephila clavipes]|nr:hypothetical protein TNCV_708631 [Trichonephila clavipes]